VRESLDLCLGCKGCKTDCPVGVDMAKYKSEFLYHHYRGRLRPLAHYSMGWLPVLARIASTAPAAVNAVLSSRFAGLLKRMGGVAGNRPLPLFARRSLTRWFGARPRAASSGQPRVVLWPDTFSNYFTAEAGVAAVEVLEAAGYAVQIPAGAQCCGLTWVSTGQLGIARRVLRRALTAVAAELDAGTPVVCLEPSCASLLRSDLPELLPDDPRAARLAASVSTLAEFLARVGLPELAREPDSGPAARPTVIQPHCHLDAADVARIDAGLLGQLGRVASTLDTGCCGLAGHFGFERAHSALSRKVAEHALLPALAGLDPGTTVVADGFSCRTQISHLTGRTARHLAEVVRDALGKDGTASG
jgi:Fe-S oxidoreductase